MEMTPESQSQSTKKNPKNTNKRIKKKHKYENIVESSSGLIQQEFWPQLLKRRTTYFGLRFFDTRLSSV